MDKNKIKDGLDHFIGKEQLFTPRLKNRILSKTKSTHTTQKKQLVYYLGPIMSGIIVLLIFSGLIIYTITEGENTTSESPQLSPEEENISQNIAELETRLEQLQIENESLAEENKLLKSEEEHLPGESEYELSRIGFEGNISDIKDNLIENKNIIEHDGILGGEMHFRKDEIQVLSHEWVFAPYDDGHNGGFVLLNYTIENGEISRWEIYDSYLFGEND
ncbi:bZIP transcription factor [Virgibacillus sp. C22-A2]|uniref:BZIP transcription factor n=1 Tax=Virgibacillus tibetensis TaxID=3042313 RepID=A0ABU6KI21_9BACI|nr:bZIP transcription factor [Virgibacillus sp. C22-A2]